MATMFNPRQRQLAQDDDRLFQEEMQITRTRILDLLSKHDGEMQARELFKLLEPNCVDVDTFCIEVGYQPDDLICLTKQGLIAVGAL